MDGIMGMIMACLISAMNPMVYQNGTHDLFIIICIFSKKCLATGWFLLHPHASSIVSYASSFTSGETAVALINKSSSAATVQVVVNNFKKGNNFYYYKLNGGTDNGEFSRNVLVNGSASSYASGGPSGYKTINPYGTSTVNGIAVSVPARGAVYLVIEKK